MFYNQFKTAVLLASMSSLFLLLGWYMGGQSGIVVAFIMSMIMNFITYFYSDKIVLKLYNAKPLNREQYDSIYETVAELTHHMQIPMPKLWLIDTPMANAFATGRNPKHASVALTTGIIKLLNKDELRGVIAHELSHVKNRDILISTVAATLAAAIGYLARMAQFGLFTNRDGKSNNALYNIMIAIFMPIAAMLIQFAISRSREYLADETGADSCGDPLALASALEKLDTNIASAHMDSSDTLRASTAPLFIMHPFAGKNWTTLFSTHPSIRSRVARLQTMYDKRF